MASGLAERTLTLRELNRATLARQLLLERKRLSPTAVIERLVGMQAQWPPAPYVGIWTRTTSFKREALERELVRGTVVKATFIRQTLHLATQGDYALFRAALSETNFPWETEAAKKLAPSIRAFAGSGPVTSADAIAYLEKQHGVKAGDAPRAWRAARLSAHLVHHHETALWHARPAGRFVATDIPEALDPTEACRASPPLPRGVRAGDQARHRHLEHDARARDHACARASRPAPLPRRAGPRAPRRAARPPSGSGGAGTGALPAEVGQRAPRAHRPLARAARAVPQGSHQEER